jgi:hypothetical protein
VGVWVEYMNNKANQDIAADLSTSQDNNLLSLILEEINI